MQSFSRLMIVAIAAISFFASIASAWALGNRTNIPFIYQGSLSDANYLPITDSSRAMRFKIWDASTGGTCVWSTGPAAGASNCGTASASASINAVVNNGNFTTPLGNAATNNPEILLNFNSGAFYLEVTVDTESSGYETLSPRKQFGSVPYAINADLLDGLTASEISTFGGVSGGQTLNGGTAASENLTLSSTANATKGKIYLGAALSSAWDEVNSRLGLGTASPNEQLELTGNLRLPASTSTVGIIKAAANRLLHTVGNGTTNIFVGTGAGTLTNTGDANAGFGTSSLQSLTNGGSNAALGAYSLYGNTSGTNNTAAGRSALGGISSGSSNIGIGFGAGENLTTGSNNLMIGFDIDAQSATGSNQMSIGNLIFGTGLDGTGTTVSTGNIGVGIASPLTKLDVQTGAASTIANHASIRTSNSTQHQGGLLFSSNITGVSGTDYSYKISSYTPTGSATLRIGAVANTTPNTYVNGPHIELSNSGAMSLMQSGGSGASLAVGWAGSSGDIIDARKDQNSATYIDVRNTIALGNTAARAGFRTVASDATGEFMAYPSDFSTVARRGRVVIQSNPSGVNNAPNGILIAQAAGSSGLGGIEFSSSGGNLTRMYRGMLGINNVLVPATTLDVNGGAIFGTRGAEKVLETSFTASCTNWTLSAGWTCDTTNQEVDHASGGGTNTLSQNVSAVAGETYAITFSTKNYTTGSVTPSIGGVAGTATGTSNISYSQIITATGTGNLIFTPSNDFDGSIDDISVKLLSGGDTSVYGNINLLSTSATVGIIKSGINTLLHSFGTSNFFAGVGAGNLTTTGGSGANTAVGASAMPALTSGSHNTGIGKQSLFAITSGASNTALGSGSLRSISTTGNNTAIGFDTMTAAAGSNNTALGSSALNITTGSENTAIGAFALNALTSSSNNTAVGRSALVTTVSANNTAMGYGSGSAIVGGGNNTLFGYQAGNNITSGSSNLILGYDIDAPSATSSNQMSIGNLIFGTGINGTGTTISTGNIGIGTSAPASRLHVDGSMSVKRNPQAGDYTILDTDYYTGITDTTSPRTVTIPTAASVQSGKIFIIKDESGGAGTNNITVTRSSSDTIDGATTHVISTNYGSVRLISNGTDKWFTW